MPPSRRPSLSRSRSSAWTNAQHANTSSRANTRISGFLGLRLMLKQVELKISPIDPLLSDLPFHCHAQLAEIADLLDQVVFAMHQLVAGFLVCVLDFFPGFCPPPPCCRGRYAACRRPWPRARPTPRHTSLPIASAGLCLIQMTQIATNSLRSSTTPLSFRKGIPADSAPSNWSLSSSKGNTHKFMPKP